METTEEKKAVIVHCEMYPTELAMVEITYGLVSEYEKGRPHYKHNLCTKGALELWAKCNDLIKENLMYWSNKPC